VGRFFLNIIAGTLTLLLATKFVKGVEFNGPFFILPANESQLMEFFSSLFFVGVFLGFLNFFIRPILNFITLPLRIITFGLFSLVINFFLILIVDIVFEELKIQGFIPLLWTTIIFWILTLLVLAVFPKIKKPL
jgi:putative membrane protein